MNASAQEGQKCQILQSPLERAGLLTAKPSSQSPERNLVLNFSIDVVAHTFNFRMQRHVDQVQVSQSYTVRPYLKIFHLLLLTRDGTAAICKNINK